MQRPQVMGNAEREKERERERAPRLFVYKMFPLHPYVIPFTNMWNHIGRQTTT